jgi:hypothetical protein
MNPSEPVTNAEQEIAAAPVEVPPSAAAPPLPESAPKIVGYCRACGKALLEGTGVPEALGAIYCEAHRPQGQNPVVQSPLTQGSWTQTAEHAASSAPYTTPPYTAPPYTAPPYSTSPYENQQRYASQPPPLPPFSPLHAGASPGLAFLLGLIPGVGAVYNGQYAKGLLHVVIFGVLISMTSNGSSGFEPLFGLLIGCFYFYMPFEAYHTAKKRQAGLPVDEFSSVFPQSAFLQRSGAPRVPVGPILLIVIGVLFLLSNLEIIEMRKLMRYWPALLIVMGVYMIYARLTDSAEGRRNRG